MPHHHSVLIPCHSPPDHATLPPRSSEHSPQGLCAYCCLCLQFSFPICLQGPRPSLPSALCSKITFETFPEPPLYKAVPSPTSMPIFSMALTLISHLYSYMFLFSVWELSMMWDKMRTTAQETVFQRSLKNCSEHVRGEVSIIYDFSEGGICRGLLLVTRSRCHC